MAADHNPIDLGSAYMIEYGFERRQISMNVVQYRDPYVVTSGANRSICSAVICGSAEAALRRLP